MFPTMNIIAHAQCGALHGARVCHSHLPKESCTVRLVEFHVATMSMYSSRRRSRQASRSQLGEGNTVDLYISVFIKN